MFIEISAITRMAISQLVEVSKHLELTRIDFSLLQVSEWYQFDVCSIILLKVDLKL